MKNNKKWINFLTTLELYCNASNVVFCEAIIDWLKKNKRAFMVKDWEAWNFHLLTQLNPENFYVDEVDMSPKERLAQMKIFGNDLQNSSVLMLINSILMEHLTLITDEECPSCESDCVYLSSLDKKYIIVSCNRCGFEKIVSHDEEITGNIDIIPASKEQIIQFKKKVRIHRMSFKSTQSNGGIKGKVMILIKKLLKINDT